MTCKIGLLGNWGLAKEVLQVLLNSSSFSVEFVVTQHEEGNYNDRWFNAVWNLANVHQIPTYDQMQFKNNDKKLIDLVQKNNVDLIVSCAYRFLIGEPLIALFNSRKGIINLHASLLPKYRGPSPVIWALINNDIEIGITLHYVDKGCDTGDIIYQSSVLNTQESTINTITEDLKREGVKIFKKYMNCIENNLDVPRKKQDHSLTIHAPRLRKKDLMVDFYQSDTHISNFIKATSNYRPYFIIKGNEFMIKKVSREDEVSGKPSRIIKVIDNERIVVGTKGKNMIIDFENSNLINMNENMILNNLKQ